MKLELQINSKALNDISRSLEVTGIMITPPIEESFWLFRVPVSEDQAIVGFPKFSVIGVGFQKEDDWNTNLPSGAFAIDIYEHIKHNKGSKSISRGRCIEAILLIQKAVHAMVKNETLEKVKESYSDDSRMDAICKYLRKSNAWELAEASGR
jgi:hypothetical protein